MGAGKARLAGAPISRNGLISRDCEADYFRVAAAAGQGSKI
jgi:hypothetical protein